MTSRSPQRPDLKTLSKKDTWRSRFKEQCKQKALASRNQILQQKRSDGTLDKSSPAEIQSAIRDAINSEWEATRRLASGGGGGGGGSQMNVDGEEDDDRFGYSGDLDDLDGCPAELSEADFLKFVEDSLFEELKREEEFMLEQALKFEADEVDSLLDSHFAPAAVLCPLCLNNNLMLNKGIVFCRCGLRLDTQEDSFTLMDIKALIQNVFDEHSQSCLNRPTVVQESSPVFSGLVLRCSSCPMVRIVL